MTTLLLTLAIVFLCDRSAKALVFRRLGLGRSWSLAGLVTIRPAHHPHPRPWPQGSSVEWSSVWAMGFVGSLGLAQLAPFDTLAGLVGLGAVLGGSLGNLVDRVRHGAVLDFLRLANSPLFNPADVALACGLALVLGLGCLELLTPPPARLHEMQVVPDRSEARARRTPSTARGTQAVSVSMGFVPFPSTDEVESPFEPWSRGSVDGALDPGGPSSPRGSCDRVTCGASQDGSILRSEACSGDPSAHDLTGSSSALGAEEDDVPTSTVCLEPPPYSREQVLP